MNDTSDLKPFISGHGRARLVTSLLLVGIILDLAAMVMGFAQIELLSRIDQGQAVSASEVANNDSRQEAVGTLGRLVYWTTAISFLAWIHRAHRNLSALGVGGLKYSPMWAVGCFFVPIMNLFRPYQVMREIWRASDPGGKAYHDSWCPKSGAPALMGWWWGSWLAYNLITTLAYRFSRLIETPHELMMKSWVDVVADALSIMSAVFAALVVTTIDEWQEEKNRHLKDSSSPLETPSLPVPT